MNQIPKRLKKEPLIEAIWQAQFDSEEGLSAVVTQTAQSPRFVQDAVAEAFKPRTELGRRLLALRRAYVANGGPLLDADAFDREMQQRRGGVSDE